MLIRRNPSLYLLCNCIIHDYDAGIMNSELTLEQAREALERAIAHLTQDYLGPNENTLLRLVIATATRLWSALPESVIFFVGGQLVLADGEEHDMFEPFTAPVVYETLAALLSANTPVEAGWQSERCQRYNPLCPTGNACIFANSAEARAVAATESEGYYACSIKSPGEPAAASPT